MSSSRARCPWTHKLSHAISMVAIVFALILVAATCAGLPLALRP